MVQIGRCQCGELGRECLRGTGGERRAGQVGDARCLLADRVCDLANSVADVRDERPSVSVEIPLTLVIPQVAPLPPNDLREIPGELPVEDVTVRIAMRGSDRAVPAGGRWLSYGVGRPGNRVIGHTAALAACVTHVAFIHFPGRLRCAHYFRS